VQQLPQCRQSHCGSIGQNPQLATQPNERQVVRVVALACSFNAPRFSETASTLCPKAVRKASRLGCLQRKRAGVTEVTVGLSRAAIIRCLD
jgi:1-deoxy-D-xylulose 5-phosphate reductoisomerase